MSAPAAQRKPRRLKDQLLDYLLSFVGEETHAGPTRMVIVSVVVTLFVIASRVFEPITELPLLDQLLPPDGARAALPPAANYMLEFFASFFTRQTMRHALPPLLGAGLALYLGAAYLRDLLELPNLSLAYRYLATTVMNRDFPRLTIEGGKASVSDAETNPLLKIGGPGYADIKLGNAAIFEPPTGPPLVLGAGSHLLGRFVTLRQAYDLREMERGLKNVKLTTRDGIPLVLSDMTVRFRIRARPTRSTAQPFPVMTTAVRQATYSRKVNPTGLEEWPDMVVGAVKGIISGWIANRSMDELIPPPRDQDTAVRPPAPGVGDAEETELLIQDDEGGALLPPPYRQLLHAQINSARSHQNFASMGVEIIWVSVGHLRPDPDIDPDLKPGDDPSGRDRIHQQLIDTWKASHQAEAQESIADARVYSSAQKNLARAQADFRLITALTDGMAEAQRQGLPVDGALTDRLIELVSGIRLNPDADQVRMTFKMDKKTGEAKEL